MAKNISNTKSNTLLSGTSGNDTINNGNYQQIGGKNVTIKAFGGNDNISNNGDSVTIDGGSGNGNSWITNLGGSHVSIKSDKNTNRIINYNGKNITMVGGDGKDTLETYKGPVTMVGGKGNDSIIFRDGSEGTAIKKSSLDGGDGNDYIWNGNRYVKNITIDGGNGNDTISNDGANSTLLGGAGHDYIQIGPYASLSAVNGGTGNDSIYNMGSNVTLNGGAGNDSVVNNFGNKITISGGASNDTIYNNYNDYYGKFYDDSLGYGSNVVFNYTAGDGNDIIYGFKADSTLSIGGGSYSTQKSGNNIIVTVGTGKITLSGAASLSKVNIKGTKATATKLTVTNSTKSPMTVSSAVKTVNAASRTKAVKITGNSLANTITGGSGKDSLYGGAGNDSLVGNAGNDKLYGQAGNDKLRGGSGNDSLWGGAGNDSLWGGSGNDTFIYQAGEGTDKIFDYTSGDMLKILKSNGKSGGKFTKSKFSDGTLSLTISGGGQVIFDDVSTSTNFNINGTSYKISGSKLAKK